MNKNTFATKYEKNYVGKERKGEANMYEILEKKCLAKNIYLCEVFAPRVAKTCLPGQFVIVKIDEYGERIPLTICDYDRDKQTITIVYQVIGNSTKMMEQLSVGDSFHDFVGPLGRASELMDEPDSILKEKNILFVAGGVGAAPVYPQVKWLRKHSILADCIVGAKTKELIILEDEMSLVANQLYITTDDGSYGMKGNVNDCIKELVHNRKRPYDLVIAIGPMIMMKFVCLLTKELGIKTIVSMNPIMVDGTGMCGACRVQVGDEVKFACVDGPEFDGHLIDFDQAMARSRMYKTQEGRAKLRQIEGATHHGNCGVCQEGVAN